MNKIGKIIREHRVAQSLTQKELGDRLFLSKQTISKWETGRSLPDIETTAKLIKVLNIDPDEIFSETAEIDPSPAPSKKKKLLKSLLLSAAVAVILLVGALILKTVLVSDITLGIGVPVISATDQYSEKIIVGANNSLNEIEKSYCDEISNFTYSYVTDMGIFHDAGYQYEIKAFIEVKSFKTTVKYSGTVLTDQGPQPYHKEITLDFIPAQYDKSSTDNVSD